MRRDVDDDAVRNFDLAAELAAVEEKVKEREAELAGLCHHEEKLSAHEMDAATQEEVLEQQENQVSQAENVLATHEHEIAARAEQRIEAAHRDFREKLDAQDKRGQERLRRAEEAKDCRVHKLEKPIVTSEQSKFSKRTELLQEEVEHLVRRVEAADK